MASVTLVGIRKIYDGGSAARTAVHDLDLTIADGEFMVLVGPSGCGKSTTLRMIAGLESISAGELSIGGRRVNDLPAKDRDIAMVFQNYALYPHMTALSEHGLRAHAAKNAPGGDRDAGARCGRDPGDRGSARPAASPDVGRRAPAGGPGPGAGAPAAGVSVRRAALQPRREAPGADAARDRAAAPAARHHDDLRDPRPGRSDDAGRPDRGAQPGEAAAGGDAGGALRAAGEHLRRGIHRHAADESGHRGDPGRPVQDGRRARDFSAGGSGAGGGRRPSGSGRRTSGERRRGAGRRVCCGHGSSWSSCWAAKRWFT